MRVRFSQFAPAFVGAGHEVHELHWHASHRRDTLSLTRRALRLAHWADVVVLQKPRQPGYVSAMLARVNPRIVVDVDDAMWAWSPEMARRFDRAVVSARAVVVGSETLADAVRARNPNRPVRCIRPAIEVGEYAVHEHTATGAVVIGWIGSDTSLRSDFVEAACAGIGATAHHLGAELRVVCSEPLARDDLPSTFVPWSVDTQRAELGRFDIGVMPLRDDAVARGRCGLKVLQYMAAGIPVVASPVGVAHELVEPGRTGFLPRTADEWASALAALAGDADLRRAMGAHARARARAEFDQARAGTRLLEVLVAVGSGTPP